MLNFLLKAVGLVADEDEKESLTKEELKKLVFRNPFSKYLPYGYYDEELGIYYNLDDTVGILFECFPLLFLSEVSLNALKGILRLPYPEKSILQFICYADPNVEYFLDSFLARKKRENLPEFVSKSFISLTEHYKNMRARLGIFSKIFRVIVALKFPSKNVPVERIKELKASLRESLKAARLYPHEMTPDILLQMLRRLFNDRVSEAEFEWCRYTPLNKQIIFSETEVKKEGKFIKSGSKYFKCISPKVLPHKIDPFFGNFLSGSYEGVEGDISQIPCPFFITLTVFLNDQKTKIHSKANLILQQQAFGSFVPMLQRKKDEFLQVLTKLEEGEKFFPVVLTLWMYDTDKNTLEESSYRAAKTWENLGCVMQEELFIQVPLFVYSLPFGAYNYEQGLFFLDRHFIVPTETIAAMVPVQTDYQGVKEPALLFLGRKGQVIGLDIFSEYAPNYNFLIVAPTGKGKSFTANYIVANYYSMGVKVRIVDIGRSYLKLCNFFKGRFIDFTPDSNICFNFFETIKDPQYDIPIITQIITHMAITQTGALPGRVSIESAINIINAAVKSVIRSKGQEATIDDVYEYLSTFPKYFDDYDLLCSEEKPYCEEDFSLVATHLAFNLYKFTSSGQYGRWFVGKNTFDIANDEFVVLELEHLKPLKDLFGVIVLVVLNAVTQDLYLSDKITPRMVLLDEAWQFLQDTKAFQDVIEEGYRRARKYYGSFGIITQSILDLEHFGRVGQVINSNAGFKFYLESGDFALAKEKGLLPFKDELSFYMLNSVKYNAPRYSEIFVYSERFGSGIIRLTVDDYSYYVYTSNPREIGEIESMVKSGMSYDEAINEMIRKHRK